MVLNNHLVHHHLVGATGNDGFVTQCYRRVATDSKQMTALKENGIAASP